MPKFKEAVIYTRSVSESNGQAIVIQQLKQCKIFAAQQGLKVIANFHDDSVSDLEKSRPALVELLEKIVKFPNLIILIYSKDNLAIHPILRSGLELMIEKSGATLVVVSERKGSLSTPSSSD